MTRIGLFRCAENDHKCPLTSCFKCLRSCKEGFAGYDETELVGVFTIDPSPEAAVNLGKIMKAKGADVIHAVTCAFAHKQDGKWVMGDGFCDNLDELLSMVAAEAQIPCVKGSAHLPAGYEPERFG